ncbi:hypothetical protein A9Z42_0046930 [Trichoderma parareesei]|uniref:Uncharacterized protein n=1 Tax=Trichoderma parareesei TaxID=858221 RepID=A0A2H2ZPY1_TRIPA|nr:hypothetical protein A9Z42_0046930 [Trichoderma parareesei]
MWQLVQILSASQLWFSDGNSIETIRGGRGISSRLIVDGQGFLDVTEVHTPGAMALDANGATLWLKRHGRSGDTPECPSLGSSSFPLSLSLGADNDGTFDLDFAQLPGPCYSASKQASGRLKPLPAISVEDAAVVSNMIDERLIPYQNITDAPSRPIEEIKVMGRQLFPFTPHYFELAMCLYDWTTASFARMVLFKIFQYTGISSGVASRPHPLDGESIALSIWQSNFSVYTPQNADYMREFMMEPADSLENLTAQLDAVMEQVYALNEIENRLLAAAMEALPRTSIMSKPRLFSGQVDMGQLGTERFGIEFLECPLNEGPVDVEMAIPLEDALTSYMAVGKTVTTKMAWSFTDNMADALHYSNGIVLVLDPPSEARVWDAVSFVTPLSDDPHKTEYVAAPGTKFEVRSVWYTVVLGRNVTMIGLEPVARGEGKRGIKGQYEGAGGQRVLY